MRKRTQCALAALLSMVLLFCLVPAAGADAPDLDDGKNTVTIGLDSQADFIEDIVKAKLQADFYLVAPASPVAGVDSYSLSLQAPFASAEVRKGVTAAQELETLTKPAETEPKFDDLVSALFGVVQKDSTVPAPVVAAAVGEAEEIVCTGLNPGMYMVLIHSSTLTEKSVDAEKGYLKEEYVQPGDPNAEPVKTVVGTRGLSNSYEYTFKPMLVTVPGILGPDGKTPVFNTTEEGTWTNEVTTKAKAEREIRNGDLMIIKNVDIPGSDPVSFNFTVEWTDAAGKKQSRVVSIRFEGEERKEYILAKAIPIGTEVTVTEEDPGVSFTALTGPQTATILATPSWEQTGTEKPAADQDDVAEFTNHRTRPGGSFSIVNRFVQKDAANPEGTGYEDSAAADAATRTGS